MTTSRNELKQSAEVWTNCGDDVENHAKFHTLRDQRSALHENPRAATQIQHHISAATHDATATSANSTAFHNPYYYC